MKSIIFYCFFLLFSINVSGMDIPFFLDEKGDSNYIFIAVIIEGKTKGVHGEMFLDGPIFFRVKSDYQFRTNYSNPLQFFDENGYDTFIYRLTDKNNEKIYPKMALNFGYYKELHYCISIYRVKKENINIEDFNPGTTWYNKRYENNPVLFEEIEIYDYSDLEIVSLFHFNLGYDDFSWDEFDKYEFLKSFLGK